MKISKSVVRPCFFCIFVLFFAFSVPHVYGRAGGGDNYSGGDSSGGGGGYGGGDYGGEDHGSFSRNYEPTYGYTNSPFARELTAEDAKYLFPVLAFLIFIFLLIRNLDRRPGIRLARAIVPGGNVHHELLIEVPVDALLKRDPAFNPDAFKKRVSSAFLKIQDAWSRQNMAPARAFVSDGVMERFTLLLDMQKAQGFCNRMERVKVLQSGIVYAETGAHFDAVHVSIRASAVDRYFSLNDGRVLRGSKKPQQFTEVWSFIRRPGVQTLKKPGLIEGRCPQCGASLEVADAAQCKNCHSWVASGEYDWVLSEITQWCEWRSKHAFFDIPGLKPLSQEDAQFNVQFLEDRVSVAFWKWQCALWKGTPGLLRSVAADDFCAELGAKIKERHVFYKNVGVGSVELLACEPAADSFRSHVSVKWSGERFEENHGNEAETSPVRLEHIFVLFRKKNVQTDIRSGLYSAHCHQCGAPLSRGDFSQCESCGALFNDGTHHWVVTAVVPVAMWSMPCVPEAREIYRTDAGALQSGAKAFEQGVLPVLSRAEILSAMVYAAMADGNAGEMEMSPLCAFADKHSVSRQELFKMFKAAAAGELDAPPLDSQEKVNAFMKVLFRMSLADGKVSDAEMKVFVDFGKKHSLTPDDVRLKLENVQKEMQTKQMLSDARQA